MKKYIWLLVCFHMFSFRSFCQEADQKEKTIYYFNPRWSPDGSRILFESTRNGESCIFSIHKNGTDLQQITRQSSGQAAWSPDGNRIVYYRTINKNLQVFTNDASGGAERPLLISGSQDYGPSWSVAGKIAFMSNATGGYISHFIYTINEDGSHLRRITDTTYDCMAPQWSPDGTKILFIRATWTSKTYKTITRAEMQQINQSEEIMVMNADGKNIYRIAAPLSSFSNPVWSRDGKSIYVKSGSDTSTIIYRMNKKGRKIRKVCQIDKRVGSFDVSPQGGHIVFEYENNKKFGIYLFDIQKGTAHRLIGDS